MRSIILFLFTACVILTGCHKDNSTTTTTSTTTITTTTVNKVDGIIYSSCGNYVGNDISFAFHISGNGALGITSKHWDFGDGSSSENLSPVHAYASPGTYTVTLSINGVTVDTSIVITIQSGSSYTGHMAGNRHWIGGGSGIVDEFSFYDLPPSGNIDTQLSVTVVNDGIVRVPLFSPSGITLNLTQTDAVNNVLTFTNCSRTSVILKYYYTVDSMVYTDSWTGNVGHGFENLGMHTVR